MYRQEIQVVDCTIRDGGLINNHHFSVEFVRDVYKALSDAGVNTMEIGYKNSNKLFSEKEFGPWKFCSDEILEQVIDGQKSNIKLSCMVDIGRVDMEDVKNADQSPVDMIRTATYVKDIDKAIDMANSFHDKGYETTVNIMAISRDRGHELNEALKQLEKEFQGEVINIVDSFGSLYQESTEELVNLFKELCPSKIIGIHAHNNQQLAFSNTIEAIIHGANSLDATIYGIGRAAGNCPLELLMGFLKNPNFDIRPVLDIIAKKFIPLREEIEWGYVIPFAIAGMMNEHPRAAIELRKSAEKENYKEFYESLQPDNAE